MTGIEFNDWIFENRIQSHTERIIRQVRENEPFRRVEGGKSNVAGR